MPRIVLGISSSFCANFLKGQVSFLVEQGWEVIIISGPGKEIEQLAETEQARLYPVNFDKSISPFSNLRILGAIVRILKAEKPLLVNAGNPQFGFLIMLACWLIGLKNRVFTLHGLVSDNKTGIKKRIIRLTEKITCGIAKRVIVVSPSLMTHAIEENILMPAKGVVIANGSCNGVNAQEFERNNCVLTAAEQHRRLLKMHDNEFIIGYVGRLSRDKGIDILFTGFNLLKKKYPSIRLLIAGPIEEKDPFSPIYKRQLFEDPDIYFVGKVDEVAPYYALMHVLVLSSFREGFGNVLIEAAAMEVPVIAPDIPGCKNALEAGLNGFFFEKGNAFAMNAAIEKYMSDESLRLDHGRNGRKFVQEKFSQEKIWRGLLDEYNQFK